MVERTHFVTGITYLATANRHPSLGRVKINQKFITPIGRGTVQHKANGTDLKTLLHPVYGWWKLDSQFRPSPGKNPP